MEQNKKIDIIKQNIEQEPFARLFSIKVIDLTEGHSKVTMKIKKEYDNIFNITHGGAIFSLLDVAFGSAANSYGTISVAININVSYIKPAKVGDVLTAEADEVTRSSKIANFRIIVKNDEDDVIAVAQAVALPEERSPSISGVIK